MTGDAAVASLLDRCVFPPAGIAVECAVSGGADSSALLVLAVHAGLEVTAVHVDHGLRAESHQEVEVVRALADRFGARFRAERAEIDPGPDLEARARTARRALLAPDALTGHTADDQAETVLINLMRGAGLDGIAAMTPGGRHPLLALRRRDTEELCTQLGIDPLDDPMNRDRRFVRTRVRHELLPLMADISGRDSVPMLTRSADVARSAVETLDVLAGSLDPTACAELRAAPPGLAAIALRRWLSVGEEHPPSNAELTRVLAVARGEAVGCEISGRRSVRRTDGILRIEATNVAADERR